jgi:hypothetical protein
MTAVPHVRLPTALILDDRVSPRARDLWCVLDDMCREQRSVEVPTGALATCAGVQLRQLRTITQELADAGWLHVAVAVGRGHANRYTPLGRARADLVGSRDVVDPGRERRQSTAGFSGERAAVIRRFSTRNTSLYTRGQEAQGQIAFELGDGRGAPRRLPWCGTCDEATRMLDWYGDNPRKCPACAGVPAPF